MTRSRSAPTQNPHPPKTPGDSSDFQVIDSGLEAEVQEGRFFRGLSILDSRFFR
ncbi:MAG: hypothetical protein VX034_05325 [Planctomycetota bacterium]|nr:hypothetical protein [Planctomycetota bacterium]MEC8240611.1 hypothetical protein [Planctomycetota bacterium]MEC8304115.1 hypothetical protein [Planctomycetota bacterium]MEC8344893.1 hypothetical protein [Planctomycetota bacterium]MEE3032767.1 hypothetical protein [Planctomycetota bacterium]